MNKSCGHHRFTSCWNLKVRIEVASLFFRKEFKWTFEQIANVSFLIDMSRKSGCHSGP